ncbi:MAG TPA: hypothetical protein VMS73_08645 [Anaerolineaceae bacterium]|nr:hypothetical protein [Anaerolineaceae bacterium]
MNPQSLSRSSNFTDIVRLALCLVLLEFSAGPVFAADILIPFSPIRSSPTAINFLASPAADKVPVAFLPFIANGETGIFGYVTLLGSPIKDIELGLWLFDGSGTSSIANTRTASDGYYVFTNAPALVSGQYYFVRYDNPNPAALTSQVSHWKTRLLDSYYAGQRLNIGNFDIGDAALLTPVDGYTHALPITFTWSLRSKFPTDSYQVKIITSTDLSEFFISTALPYISNYTLSNPPPGVKYNTLYYWYILINAPDSAVGTSNAMRRIIFTQ